MNEKKLADNLVKIHLTNNPIEIAENKGIIVLFENLGTINGYYNTTFRQKFIHVNSSLSKHKQLFTIAHELGHALLHPKANTPFLRENTYFSINKLEIEANRFAINLLINDFDLQECLEKEYSNEQIAKVFGYPKSLIELRLDI